MEMPRRIKRKRVKGWKMPENTVFVGRPSKFGNPWSVRECAQTFDLTENAARHKVVEWFRDWVGLKNDDERLDELGCYGGTRQQHARLHLHLSELRGKNLACWCEPWEPCHADVLLEMANASS